MSSRDATMFQNHGPEGALKKDLQGLGLLLGTMVSPRHQIDALLSGITQGTNLCGIYLRQKGPRDAHLTPALRSDLLSSSGWSS